VFKVKWGRPKVKGWPFAGICALVLGVLVLIDKGSVTTSSVTAAPCRVEVTVDNLVEHANPDGTSGVARTLHRGDIVDATTAVQNNYRKMQDGNWALDDFLRPLSGSKCLAQ
jgi:hypothetical protein